MAHPKVKIADNSGNEVAVTSNALDVNIAGGAAIDIGDVEVKELASEPKYNPKTRVIEGQTNALVLEEKEAYYNPGNSAVTESV